MTSRVLVVDDDTFKLVMINCVKEFKDHNPNLEGVKITQNLIVRRIARYYCGGDKE